jgi:hypothetical protein
MGYFEKIAGALFALMLVFFAAHAQAATKAQDKEFNHLSTGYPLTGVHTTVACEACHVGGVFVGTPRACDGCHATGKRVVATPKSLKHIVTDAPCETCHFNTSTFYGARYNHGTAVPGQCETCHNGRIAQGKPSAHPVTLSACDNCHRSSSWLPASWNHRDTASDCSVCHKAGGPGRNYTAATHLPMSMDTVSFTGNCKACHTNYYTFYSAYYNHVGASTSCGNCHQFAAYGPGVKQITSTTAHTNYASALITQCTSCHKSYAVGTFAAGKYDHVGAGTCDTCHSGHAAWSPAITQASTARHNVYAAAGIAACSTCHTSTAAWAGSRYNHSSGAACSTCHSGQPTWNTYIRQMSANHIPFTAATCESCHTSATSWASVARGSTLHANVTTTGAGACAVCHGSNTSYPGNGQQTARWPSFHESSKNPSAADCSAGGCHRPGGSKGVLYQKWD